MDYNLFFVLALGLCVGSFLSVLVSRLPDPKRTLVKPVRSCCPSCGAGILLRDNIPVLGYLLLGGRCRSCKTPIGVMYPLLEMLSAAIFLYSYLQFGITVAGVSAMVFLILLLATAAIDFRVYLIPDLFTVGGALAGLIFGGLQFGFVESLRYLADALVMAGGLYLFGQLVSNVLGKEALGLGDVFLIGMMATFLGLGMTVVALWLSAVSGVLFYYVHSRRHTEKHIPLGFHLAIGGAIALFVSNSASVLSMYGQAINQLAPWR